jgi:uncharacterized protein YbbC (DUF1343 family)
MVVLLCAACAGAPASSPTVTPGIDVLLDDSLHLVAGRRVGLVTNQTGVDRRGVPDGKRLIADGVQLTAIFSPEHGYRGVLDREDIGDTVDSATGIPIFSLYGRVREPTAEMLARVDVLLVDLPDIGARPYTNISTALLAMRAAARHGIPVVILDRPNPINGVQVQGPTLDRAFASFTGMLPVPLRHGMTLGELARFGDAALEIGASLTVVPAAGWRRSEWLDSTGLPWVRPSPSMPNLESATHYPGTVLFEATNLSVGRGTPMAFQVIGAPWLDAAAVARAITGLPGVTARDTIIRPVAPPDGKYDALELAAVRLAVTDRAAYDPVATAAHLFAAIVARHRDSLIVRPGRLAELAGTDRFWADLGAGTHPDTMVGRWAPGIARFREAREPYLLYR